MKKLTKTTDVTKGKVLLFFSGPYCGKCKLVKPGIEKVLATTDTTTEVYEADTSEDFCMDLAKQYRIQQLPTVVVLEDGKSVKHLIGMEHVTGKIIKENL